jgi:hypothetical protein
MRISTPKINRRLFLDLRNRLFDSRMKTVGVFSASRQAVDLRLLEWLGDVFSARFVSRKPGQIEDLDAAILLGGGDMEERAVREAGLSCLVMGEGTIPGSPNDTPSVAFSADSMVPAVFRRRTLEQKELGNFQPVSLRAGDSVLATIGDRPAWTASQTDGVRFDRFGLSLPGFDESRSLFHYFEGFNFFRLLPLVEMLRRLAGDDQWSAPGLRACFVFDDPNLRGEGYGWLNYRELVRHATKLNYHVAMATVPLDSWCASKKSAAYFSEHPDRLSLLMHGNDHLRGELASFSSEQDALARLGQALQRIERLEKSFSVRVPRVMAAPHGTCAEHGLHAMARLGFEATTLAYGAFCASNAGKAWSKRVGLKVCEVIAGLPGIPRFRFKYGQSFVLLAAYLNQAIVPYGHHHDVSGGLDVLASLAEFINSLGPVQWTDMGGIARSNYLTRRERDVFHVKSFARVFRIQAPEGVNEIAVHRPWELSEDQGLVLRVVGQQDRIFPRYRAEPISVQSGERIEIFSTHPNPAKAADVAKKSADSVAFARRQFCEWRDRFAPLTPAFLRS